MGEKINVASISMMILLTFLSVESFSTDRMMILSFLELVLVGSKLLDQQIGVDVVVLDGQKFLTERMMFLSVKSIV